MPDKEFFFTPDGLAKLEQELEELRSLRRPQVAEKIQRAKEMGGTDHNAEYELAKNDLSFVEGRILTLEQMLKKAVIIKAEPTFHSEVKMGCQVNVTDQDGRQSLYTIVGSAEANPTDGKISYQSPVGRALLGRKVGDTVEVAAPAGTIKLRVTGIV